MAEQEQQRLWRQARMKTDIQHFISKMTEIEIVDSFNVIERHLRSEIQVEFSCRYVILIMQRLTISFFPLLMLKNEGSLC